MKRKLNAGSLCGEYLVLYPEDRNPNDVYIVRIIDRDTRWDVYCNDVLFTDNDNGTGDLLCGEHDLKGLSCKNANIFSSYWSQIDECTKEDEHGVHKI